MTSIKKQLIRIKINNFLETNIFVLFFHYNSKTIHKWYAIKNKASASLTDSPKNQAYRPASKLVSLSTKAPTRTDVSTSTKVFSRSCLGSSSSQYDCSASRSHSLCGVDSEANKCQTWTKLYKPCSLQNKLKSGKPAQLVKESVDASVDVEAFTNKTNNLTPFRAALPMAKQAFEDGEAYHMLRHMYRQTSKGAINSLLVKNKIALKTFNTHNVTQKDNKGSFKNKLFRVNKTLASHTEKQLGALFQGPTILLGVNNLNFLEEILNTFTKEKVLVLLGGIYNGETVLSQIHVQKMVQLSKKNCHLVELLNQIQKPILHPLCLLKNFLSFSIVKDPQYNLLRTLTLRNNQLLQNSLLEQK